MDDFDVDRRFLRNEKPGIGHTGFLPEPMRPSALRICDQCGRWFALKVTREEAHQVYCKLTYYRCKYCGEEIAFAQQHPDHTA